MSHMMIRPNKSELDKYFQEEADYYIINAGEFYSPVHKGLIGNPTNKTSVSVNLDQKQMVILGT